MHKKLSYRILNMGLRVGLGLLAAAGIAKAQDHSPDTPTQMDLYCSGVMTDKAVPNNLYVISGEDSSYKITFSQDDLIYINTGAEQGVKVGDQFEVVRPVKDNMAATVWFKFQPTLSHAMGTTYADIGRLRVVHVDAKTSTAEIALGCDPVRRGDIVRPFAARPVPRFRNTKLDIFAPPSGKKTAMVVTSKDFSVLSGAGKIVYVNLGNEQGVLIGDYFRVFRYQGSHNDEVYQIKNTAYKVYGFGSTPVAYQWDNLPRQVIGEGIVLRTGPNSSTVLLTNSRREVFAGDYVEVE